VGEVLFVKIPISTDHGYGEDPVPDFPVGGMVELVPPVGQGVARITEQPGLPRASITPPRYPRPEETRVSSGFMKENDA